jgi:hypothetical protein
MVSAVLKQNYKKEKKMNKNIEQLLYFIERNQKLWADLEAIEQECLSEDETLVDWLQEELMTIVRLYKKGE